MKENHHYVPQFYLRYFSNNNRNINTYINKKCKYISNANIRKQGSKKKMYGDTEEIENMLMQIEYKASIILNNIRQNLWVPSKDSDRYHELLLFIMLSISRVTKEAENSEATIDKIAKIMIKMDPKIDISEDEFETFKVGYDVPSALPMETAAVSYPAILDLKPILIINNSDREFITSDSPVTKYNFHVVKRKYHMRGYGLSSRGLQIFYPITPKLLLMLYDSEVYDLIGESGGKVVVNRGKDIDEINKLTFLDSYDFLYFSSKIKESYINRITKGLKPTFSIENNVIEFGSDKEKLIGVQPPDTRYPINIRFIKIRSKYMTCQLPLHMAGLMRPESERNMDGVRNHDFG